MHLHERAYVRTEFTEIKLFRDQEYFCHYYSLQDRLLIRKNGPLMNSFPSKHFDMNLYGTIVYWVQGELTEWAFHESDFLLPLRIFTKDIDPSSFDILKSFSRGVDVSFSFN